jgi:transcriptional regulator GlxA family with amidase domain
MHTVAIVVLDNFVPLDLGIPCDVLGRCGGSEKQSFYRVRVCAERRLARTGAFDLHTRFGLSTVRAADTVLVPGITNPDLPVPPAVIAALRAAWNNGARLASICSGAFVLAAAGLLDGRRATTHWLGTDTLARRYPAIDVEPDVLFVDDGRVITSAGASAGLDMCLHLVRRDYGQAVAAHAARLAVAPLNRDGGQTQFVRQEAPQTKDSLAPVLEWMGTHLNLEMDVESLAHRAHMSSRTFARRFREQTGTTPLQWLLTARVRRAQELLETNRRPIDDVAERCGFESVVTFRTHFRRIVGLNPRTYRLRFDHRTSGTRSRKGGEGGMAPRR